MSQILFLALLGFAAYLAWRSFNRPAQVRQRPRVFRPHAAQDRENVTQLELDPKTGVYRPVDRTDFRERPPRR